MGLVNETRKCANPWCQNEIEAFMSYPLCGSCSGRDERMRAALRSGNAKIYRAIHEIIYPWWYIPLLRRHTPVWVHRHIARTIVYRDHLVREFHIEGANRDPVDWEAMDNSSSLRELREVDQ